MITPRLAELGMEELQQDIYIILSSSAIYFYPILHRNLLLNPLINLESKDCILHMSIKLWFDKNQNVMQSDESTEMGKCQTLYDILYQ